MVNKIRISKSSPQKAFLSLGPQLNLPSKVLYSTVNSKDGLTRPFYPMKHNPQNTQKFERLSNTSRVIISVDCITKLSSCCISYLKLSLVHKTKLLCRQNERKLPVRMCFICRLDYEHFLCFFAHHESVKRKRARIGKWPWGIWDRNARLAPRFPPFSLYARWTSGKKLLVVYILLQFSNLFSKP